MRVACYRLKTLRASWFRSSREESKRDSAWLNNSQNRAIREKRYKWEILEIETHDILDRALVRAKANKELGAIDAPSYHMIVEKVSSLKKLKFTQEYESWKDKETYEWMKYKVAAEVGGDQELESFRLYEKVKID